MKQLKSFIPLRIGGDMFKWLGNCAMPKNREAFTEKAKDLINIDPGAMQWGTAGLHMNFEGNFCHDLDGAARLLVYRFNTRNLPAPVIAEAMKTRLQKFEERQGRAANKTEYMEFKESVVADLLPKAFIRRTIVPVLVYPDLMMVYTTSAKTCESVIVMMQRLAELKKDLEFAPRWIETVNSRHFTMKQLALGTDIGERHAAAVVAANTIKIKGADKRAFTIKDFDVGHDEVQDLVGHEGHLVTELAMDVLDEPDRELSVSFLYTDKGMFKNVKTLATQAKDVDVGDQHATCWIIAKEHKRMHDLMLEVLGGEQEPVDLDDEL